jgi:hypothetical protein
MEIATEEQLNQFQEIEWLITDLCKKLRCSRDELLNKTKQLQTNLEQHQQKIIELKKIS